MLYNIGYFGPHILFVIIFTQLTDGRLHFVLLQVLNLLVNLVLKNVVRQPRPLGAINVNQWDKLDEHQYGMPSLHAQLMGSMLLYALLHSQKWGLPILFTAVTLWQRYVCRKHTVLQLAAGVLTGGTLCIFFELDPLRWDVFDEIFV